MWGEPSNKGQSNFSELIHVYEHHGLALMNFLGFTRASSEIHTACALTW